MDKTSLFQKYNHLRRYFPTRIEKALSLAQRPQERPYFTTALTCTCPDRFLRGTTCKHMLAIHLATDYAFTTGQKVTDVTNLASEYVVWEVSRDYVEMMNGEILPRANLIAK